MLAIAIPYFGCNYFDNVKLPTYTDGATSTQVDGQPTAHQARLRVASLFCRIYERRFCVRASATASMRERASSLERMEEM